MGPNTALVKLTPSAHHLRNGCAYAVNGMLALGPLSIPTGLYLLHSLTRWRRNRLPSCCW